MSGIFGTLFALEDGKAVLTRPLPRLRPITVMPVAMRSFAEIEADMDYYASLTPQQAELAAYGELPRTLASDLREDR